MQGVLHIIPTGSHQPHRVMPMSRPLLVEELQDAIGGTLQLVPGFDSIIRNGKPVPCIVFSHEHAKLSGMPANTWADLLWRTSLLRDHGLPDINDVLIGPIAVVTGDEEFLAEL